MKSQLDKFEKRFNYRQHLPFLLESEELAIERLAIKIINKMELYKEYSFSSLFGFVLGEKLTFSNKKAKSSSVIIWKLIESDNIEWVDCNCGSFGNFKRLK